MQIEGRNPVYEAIKAEKQISVIYVESKITGSPKIREILSTAYKRGIRVNKVTRPKLDRISHTKVHQGIIAIRKRDFYKLGDVLRDLEKTRKPAFFVIINEVLYQQNLGAIIRSAECAGASGVIIPMNIQITSECIRASMGAIEHIPVINSNTFNAIKSLQNFGARVFALEADGDKYIYEEDLSGDLAIIIGGENKGVSKPILSKCDGVLKIPLFGQVNSLNMSNATAIALFEKVRQDGKYK